MRIGIASISHESNTFANVKTTEAAFNISYGEEIKEQNRNVRNYLGGIIDKGMDLDVELVPTFSAETGPSGTILKSAFESLKDKLVESIRSAGHLEALCLALHGGGVAEDYDDIEGEILKSIRKEVGYDIPVVSTLDLHGNITDVMINEATALLGVNHYPHTDTFERGQEAIDLTVQIVKGKVAPVMKWTKLPLLIFPSTSYQSPVKDMNEWCWEMEKKESVIDCTFFHGFARADIWQTGASIVTITDNNPELSQEISEKTARKVWEIRDQFSKNYPTPEKGIEQALTAEGYPIILNETNDNPGSGAPGDGTFLLKALVEKNVPRSCFGFIYDPEAVRMAHDAGVGSTIQVEIGAKTDTKHGKPLPVKAYVKSLTDGKFVQTSRMGQGANINLGKSTRLQVGNVDIILCSVRSQTTDEQIFQLHGIDVTEYKLVALKSAQHFRASFQPIAKKIITVDFPGISTSNPSFYNYQNIKRPIYPLDIDCEFPVAEKNSSSM